MLLKNDQAGKNWKITKCYQQNREKSDIVYSQQGITKKITSTCDMNGSKKKPCKLKEARHKENVPEDSNNIKFKNKRG